MRSAPSVTIAVAMLAMGGMARGESFLQLAASDDGGAWLLVDRTASIQVGPGYSEPGPRRVELRRIARDGQLAAEQVVRDEPIEAIAVARDDAALWAVTERAVLRRNRAGAWTALDTPPSTARTRESLQAFYAIAPLARDRALVARGCPGHARDPVVGPPPCSELFVVDIGERRVDPPLELEGRVEVTVADGRGGAWIVVARDDRSHYDAHRGFAHLANGVWTAWMSDGQSLASMRDGGAAPYEPRVIAATRDGAIGATGHDVIELGDRGAGSALRVDDSGRPSGDTLAIVARGDEIVLVTSPRSLGLHDVDDCSPSIRAVSRATRKVTVEDIPTPRWWRRSHQLSCPAVLQADEAGGRLWLVSRDAIFYRDGDRWRTIEAAGAQSDLDSPVRLAFSAPVALGYVGRDVGGGGFALGVRPEFVLARDIANPRFGIGPFAELQTLGGGHRATYFGGGVTAVRYGARLGLAGSLGLDGVYTAGSWHGQLVASAFVGLRRLYDRDLPLDAPFGVRVDVRPSTAALPTTVTASLSLDIASVGVAIAVLAGALRSD